MDNGFGGLNHVDVPTSHLFTVENLKSKHVKIKHQNPFAFRNVKYAVFH